MDRLLFQSYDQPRRWEIVIEFLCREDKPVDSFRENLDKKNPLREMIPIFRTLYVLLIMTKESHHFYKKICSSKLVEVFKNHQTPPQTRVRQAVRRRSAHQGCFDSSASAIARQCLIVGQTHNPPIRSRSSFVASMRQVRSVPPFGSVAG